MKELNQTQYDELYGEAKVTEWQLAVQEYVQGVSDATDKLATKVVELWGKQELSTDDLNVLRQLTPIYAKGAVNWMYLADCIKGKSEARENSWKSLKEFEEYRERRNQEK